MVKNISENKFSHVVLKVSTPQEFTDYYLMVINENIVHEKRLMPKEIILVREFILWQIRNGPITNEKEWNDFRDGVKEKRIFKKDTALATQKGSIKKKGWIKVDGKYKMSVSNNYVEAVRKKFVTLTITTDESLINFDEVKVATKPKD